MTQTSLPTCQSGSWGPHRPLSPAGLVATPQQRRRPPAQPCPESAEEDLRLPGRAHILTFPPGVEELPTAGPAWGLASWGCHTNDQRSGA